MYRIRNSAIEWLYLRANGIEDEDIESICMAMKESSIKYLDLSFNNFGKNSIKFFVETLRENNVLLYLGLAGLNLTIEDIIPLLGEFGRIDIPMEQYEEILVRIKERNAIIEKNKKARKKKQEPVPLVPNVIQDDKGNPYILKHEDFKHLNLALNNLDDSAVEEIDKLLARTTSRFVLTITDNKISSEGLNRLKAKYRNRVIT